MWGSHTSNFTQISLEVWKVEHKFCYARKYGCHWPDFDETKACNTFGKELLH
jgi:hypothetical protein